MANRRNNEEFLAALGARIKDRRECRGLSLKGLAQMTDMSVAGLWGIEQGCADPRASTLWRLSRALGVTIDWLVKGDETLENPDGSAG